MVEGLPCELCICTFRHTVAVTFLALNSQASNRCKLQQLCFNLHWQMYFLTDMDIERALSESLNNITHVDLTSTAEVLAAVAAFRLLVSKQATAGGPGAHWLQADVDTDLIY